MCPHTFPVENAAALESPDRFRYCSVEELLDYVTTGVEHGDRVLDLGSGTGFFTREVAPCVDVLLAIDIQPGMHRYHRDMGCHNHTALVAGNAETLPIAGNSVQTVYSTMTFHEYFRPPVLEEISRVLTADGRHVIIDWSPTGPESAGPPVDERVSLPDAIQAHRNHGFNVETARERQHTYLLSARTAATQSF